MPVNRLFVIAAITVCACFGQTAPNTPFASGFESGTALQPVPGTTGGSMLQFSGTDASTGYTWPFRGWNPNIFGVHVDPQSSGDIQSSHFDDSIVTMTGHTGASTRALHLNIFGYSNGSCCSQTMVESQSLSSPVKTYYLRFWAKYPPSLLTGFQTMNNVFHSIWAYKTANNYRQEIAVDNHNSTVPRWAIQDDSRGLSDSVRYYIDPNTGAQVSAATDPSQSGGIFIYTNSENLSTPANVPFDQWFLVELYLKRSIGNDGRFYMALNGQTVFDYSHPNYGVGNEEVNNMYNVTDYSNYFPAEMWLDDMLWRDSPPCATLPCGASGTGVASTSSQPPFITSPQGIIGTVGSAVHYQTIATNSPTSYSGSNFPSGLSINTSTGLVSGTPTTGGRYIGFITARSAIGSNFKEIVFQINNTPSSAPTLSSFTAGPTSISPGQWSKLQWAQSGATTLTINGVNVNGQDPYPVNPTVTTTYTLSAQNTAGSAPTRTATVIVSGTSPTPTITSFIASPPAIALGQSSTLSWITSGQTSLSIDQGVGTVTGLTSKTVTPSATTTYTLTATNTSGSVSSPPATVTVSARPTISSFTATPSTPITPGSSVTLAWTSTGGTSATLNGSPVALSGTQIVSPLTTTNYTLVVSNSAGPASQTVTVNVGALPVISAFTATPSTVALGGSSTLALASTGGTSCSIDQGVGTVACNSSTSVSPLTSKIYTVTATNSFGSVTAQALVGVSISALVGAAVVNGQVVIH